MDRLRDQFILVLARHAGGWINNGSPGDVRCNCGHKGALGEFHGVHVVDDLISTLQKNGTT